MVKIKVENLADVIRAKAGELPEDRVRHIEIEALVDTGATLLCLPKSKIDELGLLLLDKRRTTTANGAVDREIYRGASLTLLDRTCTIDVMELPEDVPPLVGYLALENLDLVVDPKSQTVIPNPAHDGKFVMDLY
jgi:predicted aspartyl protease